MASTITAMPSSPNYHRLKTVDNLHKWRGEILYRIDEIESDAVVLDRAAAF